MTATAARMVAYMRPAEMAEKAESIAVQVSAISAGLIINSWPITWRFMWIKNTNGRELSTNFGR